MKGIGIVVFILFLSCLELTCDKKTPENKDAILCVCSVMCAQTQDLKSKRLGNVVLIPFSRGLQKNNAWSRNQTSAPVHKFNSLPFGSATASVFFGS